MNTAPNFQDADGFYERLLDAHQGLSRDQSELLNARLIRWLHAEPIGHAALYAWALVRQQPGHTDQRSVFVRGTGHPLTGREGYHFATVQVNPFVWHLFADQQAVVL